MFNDFFEWQSFVDDSYATLPNVITHNTELRNITITEQDVEDIIT